MLHTVLSSAHTDTEVLEKMCPEPDLLNLNPTFATDPEKVT